MLLRTCLSDEVPLLVIHSAFFSHHFCVFLFGEEVTRNCAPGKTDNARQRHLHREEQLIRQSEAVILLDNFYPNLAWPHRSWELRLQLDLLKRHFIFVPCPETGFLKHPLGLGKENIHIAF